jgi:TM2 domain-containing membrane protein YozV
MTASPAKSRGVALILSALVLPGLGQIYLGRRVLGVVLILAATLALVLFVAAVGVAAGQLNLTETVAREEVRNLLPQLYGHAVSWFRVAFGLLGGSWLIGITDCLRPLEEGR